MELRTILFGYKKELFSFFVEEREAVIVNEIFSRYISGETLLQIANSLTERQVIYYKDKFNWSKQAIRRVIENNHYCGDMDYPAIISKDTFDSANTKRLSKGGEREKDSDNVAWLKEHSFCAQCNSKFSRRSHWSRNREKWGYGCGCSFDVYIDDDFYFSKIVSVMNKVIEYPEVLNRVDCVNEYQPTMDTLKEEKEINRLFEQPNPQFKTLKVAIFHNTTSKYKEISFDTSKEMTQLLMDFFGRQPRIEDVDLPLLKKTVKRIEVEKNGEIKVQFINNAAVESEVKNNDTSTESTATEDSNKN